MGVVAVTGSAGGIGGAIRARIEAAGHRVIGVDVRDAEVIADLGTADGREAACSGVAAECGGPLDGLVVAAGIGGSTEAPSSMVARINYFGAVGLLEGLRDRLAEGELEAAVAISSNSATAMPVTDATLVDQCLAGDEDGAAATAEAMDGEAVYAQAKLALGAQGPAPGRGVGARGPGERRRARPGPHVADARRARASRDRRPDPCVPHPDGPMG